MNKKGFISSALLYGMLALFLVIMMTTLAILGNRKLSMDKLKQEALNQIRFNYANINDVYALYDGFQAPNNAVWKDQSGNNHDARLYMFDDNSYIGRHLVFSGNSYIDTGIKQSNLKGKITIQTVLKITDLEAATGLWGFYNAAEGNGIYAEIGPLYGGNPENGNTINFCYYTVSKNQNCVSIMEDYFTNNYLNKLVEITVVINSGVGMDVYLNGNLYKTSPNEEEINPREDHLMIGKSFASGTTLFKGELYNYTIYNAALSAEDVMKNFATNAEKYNITA